MNARSKEVPEARPGGRWLNPVGALALVAAALVIYWPLLHAGFIWDDDGHVTRPELRGLSGLSRIWFKMGATQQYYPAMHTAFWVQHRLWGDSAPTYHLVNLLAHAAGGCLLAVFVERLLRIDASGTWSGPRVRRMAGWISGLFFVVHPIAVESVAWISEEKNTFSTVFYLGSALAFLRFWRSRSLPFYFLALALYVSAILTKSVTVTLPAALLVLIWWRTGFLQWRRDVAPLVPWFIAGIGMGIVTIWMERDYIGAKGASFGLGAADRLVLAGRVAWFYLRTWLCPTSLEFIYPRWVISTSPSQWIGTAGALACVGLGIVSARASRAPLTAILLFLGTLFPALGFFNVYPFVFSYVADHFAYLASAVLDSCLALGLVTLAMRVDGARRWLVGCFCGALAATCAFMARADSRPYVAAETLYRRTLETNPDAWLAEGNLGAILLNDGRVAEAVGHLERAHALNPDYPEPDNNLGNAYFRLGRYADSVAAYAEAVRLRPTFSEAYLNWGNALSAMGRYSEAIERYHSLLALRPDLAVGYLQAGNAYANRGDLAAAVENYQHAVRLYPGYPEAEANWGFALVQLRRIQEGLPHLTAAVAAKPGYVEGHNFLGYALAQAGRLEEAVAEYRKSIALDPSEPDVHFQLSEVLRTLGRNGEGEAEAREANRLAQARH